MTPPRTSFNPLEHPICWLMPDRLGLTTWADCLPFGMCVVDLVRPATIVELGTFTGVSYCGFCQAVKTLGIDTKCFAIDTWEGEYGAGVLDDLRRYHDRLYGEFSRLMPMAFDNACDEFQDGTIDLLHIDGSHRYETVKHDVERWLPKMSSSGVVLLHNIVVRETDFGVWKVWRELQPQYPSIELPHGKGLGLLAVGPSVPPALRGLLDASMGDRKTVQRFFAALGRPLQQDADTTRRVEALERQMNHRAREIDSVTTQLQQRSVESEGLARTLRARDEGIAWLQGELAATRLQDEGHTQTTRVAIEELSRQHDAVRRLHDQIALSRDQAIGLLEGALATERQAIRDRDAAIAALTAQLADEQRLTRSLHDGEPEVQGELKTQRQLVREREETISALRKQLADLEERSRTFLARESYLQREVETRQQIIRDREEGIVWLQGEHAETQRQRQRTEAVRESLTAQIEEIFNSRSWRWLSRYRRLRARLLRPSVQSTRTTWPDVQPALPVAAAGAPAGLSLPVASSPVPSGPAPSVAPADPYELITLLPAPALDAAAALLDSRPPGVRRHRADVICFSIIDWEFRYQRPQQLMSQFATNGHRVFYISTSRFRSPGVAPGFGVRLIKDNVYEVQLAAPRSVDVYGDVIGGDNARALLDSLAEVRAAYDISSAIAYVMIASWSKVAAEASQMWNWALVYDCMDEWDSFPGIKPAMVQAELGLVRDCDLLVVTAQRLYDKWREFERPMVLARNGVDYDFYFSRCRPNELLAGTRHPIIGYCGAIADWFDVDLMTHVARERPHYSFVLLGGVFDVDVRALQALPNVALLGQQPYTSMPQYVYHFDVCLIPFKVNKTTEATDPVKLYEYLSTGKPVVSIDLPELASCREFVYLAKGGADFLAQLDRAVVEQDRDLVNRRREFAAAHTWQDRYASISGALAGVVKRASVIIVTYNNVALTKLCIESVLRNSDHPHVEIIVVDNASSDGTPAYLRYMEGRHPEIKVILNAENQGFSKANNLGIAASGGEYVVLLNNDTMVPPGWLARLINHLRDPAIGMVGPVTNFVGNEAKVDVGYRTSGEMEQFASERARRFDGQVADIHMLAMFCTAMRRETYDEVGPLDEQFGIGMFEDDDYAQRMRASGYRVVCAADAFVHHVGQAAFKALIETGTYNELFARNRRSYEDKWRVQWAPHQHATLTFARTATPAGDRAAG